MARIVAWRQGVASRAQAKVAAQIKGPTAAVFSPCTRMVSRRRPAGRGRAQPLISPSSTNLFPSLRATPSRRLQANPAGRPTCRRSKRPRLRASCSSCSRLGLGQVSTPGEDLDIHNRHGLGQSQPLPNGPP